jgi:hypothetical protein
VEDGNKLFVTIYLGNKPSISDIRMSLIHLEDQDVDGRMGSKWTLGRLVGGKWSGFTWLRIGTVGGLL